jgi:hypothetical protein
MVDSVTSHVTRLALTASDKPSRLDITAIPGMGSSRVEWTLSTNGRDEELTQSHYSPAAAHRHVDNLLKRRQPGVPIADMYTEG